MKKSETIAELAKALCAFQEKICTVTKNKKVKVKTRNGGEYSFPYADFGAIREAIKEPLRECGLSFSQPISSNGVTTILMHSSGEYIEDTISLNQNQNPQELGSEITYKKRYSLSAILGLSTEDDDDGNWASGNTISNQEVKQEKPWYNQFETEKNIIAESIANGMPPSDVIAQLEQNFRVSNEVKNKINSI